RRPRRPPRSAPLCPYTTLFRSLVGGLERRLRRAPGVEPEQVEAVAAGDVDDATPRRDVGGRVAGEREHAGLQRAADERLAAVDQDRKSTRLNSSHVKISYAVFC